MYCHNCGKQIPDGIRFCNYCGSAQEEDQSASASATPPPVPPVQPQSAPRQGQSQQGSQQTSWQGQSQPTSQQGQQGSWQGQTQQTSQQGQQGSWQGQTQQTFQQGQQGSWQGQSQQTSQQGQQGSWQGQTQQASWQGQTQQASWQGQSQPTPQPTVSQERVLPGILGALLCSLGGVAVMVLVRQLGYVSSLSGVVMLACTVWGYSHFGRAMSKKGIVFSVLIGIVMIYVGNRLCWAIILRKMLSPNAPLTDILFFFHHLPLVNRGMLEAYQESLIQQYAFAAAGMIFLVISLVRGNRAGKKR